MKKQNMPDTGLQKHAHAQAVTPPPEVWNNISAELQKEKIRGVFWWVGSGFLGLFLIAFFALGFLYLKDKPAQVQAEYTGKTQSASLADVQELNPTAATLENEMHEENSSNAGTAAETVGSPVLLKTPAAEPGLPASVNQAALEGQKNAIQKKKQTNNAHYLQENSAQTASEKENPKAAVEMKKDDSGVAIFAAIPMLQRSDFFAVPFSEPDLKRSVVIAESKNLSLPPSWRSGVQCFSFSPATKPVYYADLFGGAGILQKNMLSLEPEFDTYRNLRDSTELAWYSANGGARIGIIRGGFTADIGIRYRQINEIFTGTRENEEQVTINTIRDDAGNIIATDTIIRYGSRTRETGNAYRHFEIPLRLGYIIGNRSWSAGVNVGATYVFSNRRKGLIYSPDGAFYNIGTDEKGYYHNHGFWRASAGAFIVYHIRPQLGIFAEPEVLFDLQSLHTPEFPLTTKFNQYSLQVGLRYFFQ